MRTSSNSWSFARPVVGAMLKCWLESTFETENDGMTPRTFKNRIAAQKRLAEILNGEYTYEIKAYAIRKFKLTLPKKAPNGSVESPS